MTAVRRQTSRGVLARALLFVALLAGMVGMHHMAIDGTETTPSSGPAAVSLSLNAEPDHSSGPSDHSHHEAGVLHLCLAVLTAAAVAVVVLLVARLALLITAVPVLFGLLRPVVSPRGPPPSVPERLSLLCVLRT